ncbi:MAG: ATP-binding protein [Gammaproteobacteria bacterium]|nr:ATP-binding protein [Gammaproteobacteria bacterium]
MNAQLLPSNVTEPTKIMIVDDDIDILESLQDVLEFEKGAFEIQTASNFILAKNLLKTFQPDIALLDIKIGKDIGLNLVPELKHAIAHIKCIMMTAFRDSNYAVEAVKKGADDYLYKPLDTESLLKTLHHYADAVQMEKCNLISQQRFQTIFNQSFQNIYILTPAGCIVDINPTVFQISKQYKEEMLGNLLWETPPFSYNPANQQKIKQLIENLVSDGYIENGMLIKLNDQRDFFIDFMAKPIINLDGTTDSIIVEVSDNSDIYFANRTIKELNSNLEAKVNERTIELKHSINLLQNENRQRQQAESALIKAKESAEQASEAKSMFLSRVSHELRTPMNAILGFTQLLEMEELSAVQADYVSEVHSASDHLLSLINEMLDLSRVESGNFDIQLATVQIQEILAESIKLVRPLADKKNITIDIMDRANYSLLVDPKRLKQIIINLLSNAIKYNIVNGSVTLLLQVLNSRQLKISIIDTGIGISEELHSRVFNPFDMLGQEYHHEGTGIGLTVTKKLVEAMHGEIDFESKQGEGSSFHIILPLSQ